MSTTAIAPTYGALFTLVSDSARYGMDYVSTSDIAEKLDEYADAVEFLVERADDDGGVLVRDADDADTARRARALLKFVVELYAPTFGTLPSEFDGVPTIVPARAPHDGAQQATALDAALVELLRAGSEYMHERNDNGACAIVPATELVEYVKSYYDGTGALTQATVTDHNGYAHHGDIDTNSGIVELLKFVNWDDVADNFVEQGWTTVEHEGVTYYVEQGQ